MSDTFWVQLPAILVSLGTLIGVILSHWRTAKNLAENTKLTVEAGKTASEAKEVATETKAAVTNGIADSIEEIHKATNSMKDQLVHATAAAEFAKGVLAGKAQAASEQKA